ncbi:molybdopterin-binding protein [Enterovirga rhinocerotis]|uniref:Molybdenum cofactor cytidylyltransferase n=1 Tax=Enterovirga rhinocerotis TaxID=1339210 RepID=A0A4R7C3N2_9HYPH|nr:molybdopterin-binding protein [Enterovirga rhinocerotis]TDR93018.1 molybdenum cofactor cytidylyltransferase [Enterovirga rhinocerotis]
MKFGVIPVGEAIGAIAAHSVRAESVALRKGQPISAELASALRAAGIETVVAARLDHGDVSEDAAAGGLAVTLAGMGVRVEPPFTGRSNLFAERPGILLVDSRTVDGINAIDEAITVATLPTFKPVVEGEMIGTVKIIPYGIESRLLGQAIGVAHSGRPLEIAPYRLRRVGAISTLTPGFKIGIVEKTLRVFGERLAPAGAGLVAASACAHATDDLREELLSRIDEVELLVVFGASAIADRRDVIPAAIEAAGGRIEHFGMPVDPGNLLLVGELRGKPVLGAPGCARSPKENGFDWVLTRLLAGLPVTRRDITAMGVGGLLMETVSRGQPRAGGAPDETTDPDEEDER